MTDVTANVVIKALEAALRDHGWLVTRTPERLRASLSDVLGSHADEHRGLVDALVVSAELGVPLEIRSAGRPGLPSVRRELEARLVGWGLSTERSTWVLDAWASLLPATTVPPVAQAPQPVSGPTTPAAPPRTAPDPTTLPDAHGGAAPAAFQAATQLPPDPGRLPSPSPVPVSSEPEVKARRSRRLAIAVVAAGVVVAATVGGVLVLAMASGEEAHKRPAAASVRRAEGTELLAAPEVSPQVASGTFAMGARKSGVRIEGLSEVDTVGTGDDELAAPKGGRLIAFRLGDWTCDYTPCNPWRTLHLSVAVGSDDVRPLPAGAGTFVVAVPADASSVDLVTSANGYPQRLSLLDGAPGPDNIAVLARKDVSDKIDKKFRATERTSIALIDGTGPGSNLFYRQVKVESAALWFFLDGKRPSSPDKAFLHVVQEYSQLGEDNYVYSLSEVEFIAADGTRYRGRDLDPRKGITDIAFEVPADTVSGTYVMGGSYRAVSTIGTPYTGVVETTRIPIHFE
jgi:hypothetical protein